MAEKPDFLEELKRRKVVRVGVVYLAVVWAVVQVADVVVPALGLSETILTVVVVLAILGFPVALALAWAFEVTPGGVVRDKDADGTPSTGWLNAPTLVAAIVLGAGGYAVGVLSGGSDEDAGLDPMAIAVLPFDSRGAEDEDGFADAIHDDILTQLSRIDAFRVTSRTSVQGYRGTTKNIPQIAGELGVGTILEGGVQRTSDRVRINIQLIDGASDEHLWAGTFDRELTAENVFAIQSEIARRVASELEATLTPGDESELAEILTVDLAALDLYHRGRRLMDLLGVDGSVQAVPVLEQAVAQDPEFTRAWALLTRAYSWQIREGASANTLPARQAMERTVELVPSSVDAALATGHYRYYARGDYEGELAAFREAELGQSGDADLTFAIANVERRLNGYEATTPLYEEVVRLDPRNARATFEVASQHIMTRRYTEADEWLGRFQALAPEENTVFVYLIEVALLGRGDTVAARAHLEEWRSGPMDAEANQTANVYHTYLGYLAGDVDTTSIPRGRSAPDQQGFGSYVAHPGGPLAVWLARLAWALGDTAGAQAAIEGAESRFVEQTPVLQPGSNVIRTDGDFFGYRSAQLIVAAWEAAFAGDAARAAEIADQAIELQSVRSDATDGNMFLRQRMLIRVVIGDLDGAMSDIVELLDQPGFTSVWELRLDPIYDPLRERSDFQALISEGG
jgi:TolB-like protein/Tfp pilus assembly protein PilF